MSGTADTRDSATVNPMLQRAVAAIRRRISGSGGPDRESRAVLLLQDLLRDYGFIPVSSSAMSFESILTICNDIVLNDRRSVIEFGSGLSTLVIASLVHREGRSRRFVSVEGNAAWHGIIARFLREAGTADAVELIHAPVVPHRLAVAGNTWYDLEAAGDTIRSSTFDAVIVDGPEAHAAGTELSRYPALPFLREHLHRERCFVLLDDAQRAGEKEVCRRWKAEYGVDLSLRVSKSACGFRGGYFNPVP